MTLWGHSKHYLGVYAMQFTVHQSTDNEGYMVHVPDFKRFQVEHKTIYKIDFQSKVL